MKPSKTIAFIIADFNKKIIGKGPENIRAYIHQNILFIIIQGALLEMEKNLLKLDPNNKESIINNRKQLLNSILPDFNSVLMRLTKKSKLEVISYSYELDSLKDKIITVVVYNENIEENF